MSPHAHVSKSPPHGSSAAFCWQLRFWSDFLLKGFFSYLSFNGGLKQSSSMAKEEGEGRSGARQCTIPLSCSFGTSPIFFSPMKIWLLATA